MDKEQNIIELRHVSKCYEKDTPVIQDFSLTIKKGEFVTLLGPSGCGKTTILRMIGGFELPTEGQILLHGEDISRLPPGRRPINTVFQKYALFPYLNVFDNIAFGLKLKKFPNDTIRHKVKKVLEVVDLEGFEKRKIATLSGGQQQRVAIARAVINEPEILLLDEPLGALDYKMRKEMQYELKEMHKELGITFLFVTHDQEEALAMSDKIVVMSDGRIQQAGKPEEIYKVPQNAFVADFIGESNIFDGEMTGDKKVSIHGVEFDCQENFPLGDHVETVIRPEAVLLFEEGTGKIQGEVYSSVFKGTFYEITVYFGKSEIVAQSERTIQPGTRVGIDIKKNGIHAMPYNENINHYTGMLDEEGRLLLVDGSLKPELSYVFPASVPQSFEGIKLEASFLPGDASLSDDPAQGFIQGNIISIIYKGDHYKYKVRSKNDVDYYVDDEWLWNMGDFVSVVVPEDKINYRVVEHYTADRR